MTTAQTTPPQKIGFAIVGCGRIAQSHFGAIERHAGRARLLDVCDTNPAALDAAVKATGACGFDNLTALLAKTEAQCIVLATPSGTMRGTYQMVTDRGQSFDADIAPFRLARPATLN